jgi:hypothetical protein
MRGLRYTTDDCLPERELHELADLLALQLYHKMGRRAYALTRQDVAELVRPYIGDLARADQRLVPWIVWDLLQEGMEIELQAR